MFEFLRKTVKDPEAVQQDPGVKQDWGVNVGVPGKNGKPGVAVGVSNKTGVTVEVGGHKITVPIGW